MTQPRQRSETKTDWFRAHPIPTLVILTLLCLLPFLGKPLHIDDPLFVWAARHIQESPANPYGFGVNWYGSEMPMSDVTKNPPLASYFLALVGFLPGWSETALHVAFLLPAVGVVLGTYFVARRFCDQPVVASLCALLTPVFLVSATSVMSDVMMLAFWMFAVHFWISGLEKTSALELLLSAVLITFSALTKYFGMSLIPLLLLYTIVRRPRSKMWIPVLIVPIVVLAGYHFGTASLYGRGLLLDAGQYAVNIPSQFGKLSMAKMLVGLTFTGGCVAVIAFFARRLWSTGIIVAGVVAAGVITAAVASAKTIGTFEMPSGGDARWLLALQIALMTVVGASLLAIAVLDAARHRSPEAVLLAAWILGTFVFAAFINWTTNGRSILPMAPAAGILIVRRMELLGERRKVTRPSGLWLPLAASAVLALSVAWGDYAHAASARNAARMIGDRYINAGRNVLFQGHWGFQYYMESLGATPTDIRQTRLAPGDVIVMPDNNTNLTELRAGLLKTEAVIEVPAGRWVTTMHPDVGAGFHADVWGPLPFAIGPAPLERYEVLSLPR